MRIKSHSAEKNQIISSIKTPLISITSFETIFKIIAQRYSIHLTEQFPTLFCIKFKIWDEEESKKKFLFVIIHSFLRFFFCYFASVVLFTPFYTQDAENFRTEHFGLFSFFCFCFLLISFYFLLFLYMYCVRVLHWGAYSLFGIKEAILLWWIHTQHTHI